MNESLLEKKSINCHFQRDNKKLFQEKHIEFMCRKGHRNAANQDNSFILLDGDVKIYGLFDGHGQNGHQVSSFAQSKVLEFIRNKHGTFFDQVNLENSTDKQIRCKIKQCFKYVQQELKRQYKAYRRTKPQFNHYKLPEKASSKENPLTELLEIPVDDESDRTGRSEEDESINGS